MDPELRQRASALARLLDGVVHREPVREPDIADHDLRWASSDLLARWIEQTSPFKQPLREEEARSMLAPGRYDDLRAAGHVRVVLGQVEPLRGREEDRLDADERADIRTLRAAGFERERRELWIEESEARAIHARHAACHKATPTWEDVAKPAFLEPRRRGGVEGFILRVDGATWLRDVVDTAAAKYWVTVLDTGVKEAEALRVWIERLEELDVVLRAPAHMSRTSRDRLLDAALELLRCDHNLGDLSEELEAAGIDPAERTVAAPTCASIHMLWEDQHREIHDERRSVLGALVGLLLEYEPSLDTVSTDGRRLFALVELAVQKPYLVFELSLRLRFARPEAIAWLLTQARSAGFALLLIADLTLQEQTTMDVWEARDVRSHDRLLMLLEDALRLYCRAIAMDQLDVEERQDVIASVLDVLRGFARKMVSSSRGSSGGPRRSDARDREVFALTVNTLFEARPASRHVVSGRPDHIALLMAELANRLVAEVPNRFSVRERVERLQVDAELLRFFRERPSAFAAQPPDRIMMLTQAIVARMRATYLEVLELEAKGDDYRLVYRDTAILRVPWAYFACAAFEREGFNEWLRLPALGAKLLSASSTEPSARAAILGGCIARLRVHLEVLLRAHEGNLTQVLAPDIRADVREALETRIGELVLASTDLTAGTADLFDEEASYSYDDSLATLVVATVDGLARFTDGRRERIFTAWIAKTSQPSVLLTIEKAGAGARRPATGSREDLRADCPG